MVIRVGLYFLCSSKVLLHISGKATSGVGRLHELFELPDGENGRC
jgi:hypothetical protein